MYNLGNGGVPVHHDPVDGMGYAQTPEIENWYELGPPPPLQDAGWRQVPDPTIPTMTEHGIYVPGHPFAIFIQVSNMGRNGCIKSWFCQYISIPMKYTVSGSTLQYKVGLTLSFLSLISRGVGGIQN